jgi:uncharacterized protein
MTDPTPLNPRRRRQERKAAATPVAAPAPQAPTEKPLVIDRAMIERARAAAQSTTVTSAALATAHRVEADRYSHTEQSAAKLEHAMDYYGWGNSNARDALSFVDATAWPGFQTLALLAQLPEYRSMHETLADEVVRTWGQVTSTSKDEAAAGKLSRLAQALERLNVRSVIRTAVIHDQAYGGAHIFPRLKAGGADLPPDTPLVLKPQFVAAGCLQELANIEPQWVTPKQYNSIDPTRPDFYRPTEWQLVSRTVHATRLWTMISRPVGDMLKAAYSFRGVSMSQLAMPYVDNWLRTRQSVSDTVKQFSITFLKMDMTALLAPGGQQSLLDRAEFFNVARDNRNLAIVDKEQEDFAQINTPLSGLDALQAQSQEQMAAVSHIPLVKLLGITPAGLNANSDGEIRVWYDYVAGYQAHNVTPLMKWILDLVQLSEFGEIDPGLSWEWHPLFELTALEEAEMRERNANTDKTYVELGVILPETAAQRLENDPNSGYAGILAERSDLDDVKDLLVQGLAKEISGPQPSPTQNDPDQDDDDQADQSDAPPTSA